MFSLIFRRILGPVYRTWASPVSRAGSAHACLASSWYCRCVYMRRRACLGRSQLFEPDLGKRASPPSYINKTTIFRGNKAWASPAFTNSEFRDAVQASVETNFVKEYYGIVWKGLSVFFRFRGWWLLATVSSYCYFSCVIHVYIHAYIHTRVHTRVHTRLQQHFMSLGMSNERALRRDWPSIH